MILKNELHRVVKKTLKLKLSTFFCTISNKYNGKDTKFKGILAELKSRKILTSEDDEQYMDYVNTAMTSPFCNEILETIYYKRVYEYCLENMDRILFNSSDELVKEDYLQIPNLNYGLPKIIINDEKILIKMTVYSMAKSNLHVRQIIMKTVSQ